MRVVVAEDSLLLREGLVRLLEEAGFEVPGQAADADELVRKVSAHKPDACVVDVRMPPTNTDDGLRAALSIREEHPGVGVLVLSAYVEEAYAHELLAGGGGVGYLLKHRVAELQRFTEAVRTVGDGGSVLDPEVVGQLMRRGRRQDSALAELTERELEVLALMAEGRSNRGIAEQLVVTERAIEKHVSGVFGKLALAPVAEDHRRVLAVLRYLGDKR